MEIHENESNKIPHIFVDLNLGPIKYADPQIITEWDAEDPLKIKNGLEENNPVASTEKFKEISFF